jgi:hypothetical protein
MAARRRRRLSLSERPGPSRRKCFATNLSSASARLTTFQAARQADSGLCD